MWQEFIVGLCVIAAAYFVLRQWLPTGKKNAAGCGGCGGCDTSKNSKSCSIPAEKNPH